MGVECESVAAGVEKGALSWTANAYESVSESEQTLCDLLPKV